MTSKEIKGLRNCNKNFKLQIFEIESDYKTGIQRQKRDPEILGHLVNPMARFIFFFLLLVVFYHVFIYLVRKMFFSNKRTDPNAEPEELVQDPSCQTYISKRLAVKKRIAGKDHYFCNPECLRNYLKKS